jgi:hypothetical protein
VAPLISSLRQLHYGALQRRVMQEPSTPSAQRTSMQTASNVRFPRRSQPVAALHVEICMAQHLSLTAQSCLSTTVSTLRRSFRIAAIRALRSILEGQTSVSGQNHHSLHDGQGSAFYRKPDGT